MFEGLSKSASRIALVAAAGFFMSGYAISGALAGGFGGDCCADLEERVAELEATTVRKGNRKVSLKLSGQVNRMIMRWDDGFEDNVYSVDNDNSSTRFRLTGKANILAGMEVGFKIEMQTESAESDDADQIDDDGGRDGDGRINGRKMSWYVKHAQFGKLTVGRDSPASRDLIGINLGGNNVISKPELQKTAGNFIIRNTNGQLDANGLHIEQFFGDLASGTLRHTEVRLETNRADLVRYDTPTIAGFTVSASWGEDDFWDVAVRYAGEFGPIRIAAGVGYRDSHMEEVDGTVADQQFEEYKGAASVMHTPTGLFATGAFVHREFDGTFFRRAVNTNLNIGDVDMRFVKAGIYTKFLPIGKTSIYGEYAEVDGGLVGQTELQNASGTAFAEITDSTLEMYGAGIVQKISGAATELYLGYRHYQMDASGINAAGNSLGGTAIEDFKLVAAGARIKF